MKRTAIAMCVVGIGALVWWTSLTGDQEAATADAGASVVVGSPPASLAPTEARLARPRASSPRRSAKGRERAREALEALQAMHRGRSLRGDVLPGAPSGRALAVPALPTEADEIREEILRVFPERYADADDADFRVPKEFVAEAVVPVVREIAESCYERHGFGADYAGRIEVYLTYYTDPEIGAIAKDAKILDERGDVSVTELGECLIASINRTTFDRYDAPGFAEVAYPITFSPPPGTR